MAITTINQENFDDQVTRSSAPVLLDFWAAWCGPCSMLSPVVEELAEEHPEISFGKVNVDEAPELAQRYQISAIPTLLLFRDGEPVDVSVGVKSKAELEAFLKRFSPPHKKFQTETEAFFLERLGFYFPISGCSGRPPLFNAFRRPNKTTQVQIPITTPTIPSTTARG